MRLVLRDRDKTSDQVEVWLDQEGDEIRLRATDSGGDDWYLLKLTPKGVYFEPDIPDSLGFPLDCGGELKVVS